MSMIPPEAMPHAVALLQEMVKIENPTEAQRRFIGTLRAAQGMVSNNAVHIAKKIQRRIEQ